jgi:hypothetical protein
LRFVGRFPTQQRTSSSRTSVCISTSRSISSTSTS